MDVEWLSLYLFVCFLLLFVGYADNSETDGHGELIEDILQPYLSWPGSTRSHRSIRSILNKHFYSVPHEYYPSPPGNLHYPLVQSFPFVKKVGTYWNERQVTGHYFLVPHPAETLVVLEPKETGGCAKKLRSKVQTTGNKQKCILATNAGFFNTTTGACIGNIVSNGWMRQSAGGAQNVQFGIRKDGNLFFGYLPEDADIEAEFRQLISGVIWLVRDGQNYVDVSLNLESPDVQETGSLENFVSVISARMAVGHNRQGQVVLAHVDGKTGQRGVNLREFADLLISWGIVNAMNLDGGGSASAVVNGTYVNYPSDVMRQTVSQPTEYCAYREVSSVLCVREPPCSPPDCHGHGECKLGRCLCHGNWEGSGCNRLECGHLNCSGHGDCTAAGCRCWHGWFGDSCELLCPRGSFGLNCSSTCRCGQRGRCDPTNGRCRCQPGYMGIGCDQQCPPGTFGPDCRLLCFCNNTCTCHHVTGACNISMKSSPYAQVGYCLASQLITQRHLVADQQDQFRMWVVAVIVLSLVAAVSLIVNISLLCLTYFHDCDSLEPRSKPHNRRTYKAPIFEQSSSDDEGLNLCEDKEAIALREKCKSNKVMPSQKTTKEYEISEPR